MTKGERKKLRAAIELLGSDGSDWDSAMSILWSLADMKSPDSFLGDTSITLYEAAKESKAILKIEETRGVDAKEIE